MRVESGWRLIPSLQQQHVEVWQPVWNTIVPAARRSKGITLIITTLSGSQCDHRRISGASRLIADIGVVGTIGLAVRP